MDVTTHPDIVIDTHTPHISWQLADEHTDDGHLLREVNQIGYSIRVKNVITDQLMWSTNYVQSSSSSHILYAGIPFTSDTSYTIAIKYYTKKHESQWYTVHFRTGLFSLMDWTGYWI
ncbi:unnamed protein product, partial [Adineta steineri]